MIRLGRSSDLWDPVSLTGAAAPNFRNPGLHVIKRASTRVVVKPVTSFGEIARLGGAYVCLASDPTRGYAVLGTSCAEAVAAGVLGRKVVFDLHPTLTLDPRNATVSVAGRRRLPDVDFDARSRFVDHSLDVLVFACPSAAERGFGILGITSTADHPLVGMGFSGHAGVIPLRLPTEAAAYIAANPEGYSVVTARTYVASSKTNAVLLDAVEKDLLSDDEAADYIRAAIAVTRPSFAGISSFQALLPLFFSQSSLGEYVGLGDVPYFTDYGAWREMNPATRDPNMRMGHAPEVGTTCPAWFCLKALPARLLTSVAGGAPGRVRLPHTGSSAPSADGRVTLIFPDCIAPDLSLFASTVENATALNASSDDTTVPMAISGTPSWSSLATVYGADVHSGVLGVHNSPGNFAFPFRGGFAYVPSAQLPRFIEGRDIRDYWLGVLPSLTYDSNLALRGPESFSFTANVDIEAAVGRAMTGQIPYAGYAAALAGTDVATIGAALDGSMTKSRVIGASWTSVEWSCYKLAHDYGEALMSNAYTIAKSA